ncbi:MAG: protein translocase subunit SecD [Pseudomonadota bacterium]|nr:protein translocase subunit SecD [Pseudomonadota bacterium]
MPASLKFKLIFIAALSLLGLYAVSPSIIYFSLPKEIRNDEEKFLANVPTWLPKKHVKLGLDLQGGVQLVLGVTTSEAVDNKIARIATEVSEWAEQEGIAIKSAFGLKDKQTLRIEFNASEPEGFNRKFKDEYFNFMQVDRGAVQGDSGATYIDYRYDDEEFKRIKDSALEQAERVIRNRVDKWGVSEPIINRRIDGSILVQLPGFKNPEKAKELLGRTAQLKFQIVDDEFTGFDKLADSVPEGIEAVTDDEAGGHQAFSSYDREQLTAFLQEHVPIDRELLFKREVLAGGKKSRYTSYVVFPQSKVNGEDILDAQVTQGDNLDRTPEVSLRFTGPGGRRFAEVTGENVKKRMAIVLDGIVESAPEILAKISGGRASITLGSGRGYADILEEAQELSLILKSGALPATIKIMEERQVGASLGPELANQGVLGVLLGLGLVFVFMLVYYRRTGAIACVALLLNGILLLAMMASFGFALSLPGIAGFILTLGMAVDANVLINERIRQELKEGRNAKNAVLNGFKKAFWTIIDANVTTLIAAVVLIETNSSGPIKGFAITLILGILVSMFTSLYCSRAFFNAIVARMTSDSELRNWILSGRAIASKTSTLNFLRPARAALGVALVLAIAVLSMGGLRGVNWGVDFAGGMEMQLGFADRVPASAVRGAATKAGLDNITIQSLGAEEKQYLLRFDSKEAADGSDNHKEQQDNLVNSLKDYKPEVLRADFVGPQIGAELRNQGLLSVVYAVFWVLLYIGFRFDTRFAPGAVIKMTLDVLIMLGFYVFFWRTFDLTSVAAFLTVVGYSVNDTIVIYDRIRENISSNAKRGLTQNINISLNETLPRTIVTSLTTMLALTGVLIFSTGQIWNFAMSMALGVLIATLSSTFIASSFVIWTEKLPMLKKLRTTTS